MQLRNETCFGVCDGFDDRFESIIIDPVSVADIVRVAEIDRGKGPVVKYRSVQLLLQLPAIKIVVAQP